MTGGSEQPFIDWLEKRMDTVKEKARVGEHSEYNLGRFRAYNDAKERYLDPDN